MKLKKLIIVSSLLLGLCEMLHAQNHLVTYPAPQEAELKNDFTVKVRQPGKEWQDVATYPVKVDEVRNTKHNVEIASMGYFDFEGRWRYRLLPITVISIPAECVRYHTKSAHR